MVEIVWIGRGGQGAFTAAKLLGAAYTLKGDAYYALAFPSFGPERRGAPVRAFSKLDSKPIRDRSQTEKADYIVILDDTLYSDDLQDLLKPNGKIIMNSKTLDIPNAIVFNGGVLASKFKLPTVNTVMLGVVSAISKLVSIEELSSAIESYMPEKIRERNKQVVIEALSEGIR